MRNKLTLKNRAIGYLARREYAGAELYRKLLPYAESEDQLESLIRDLKSEGYLSDFRFAQQLVEVRSRRFGSRRISHELRKHGLAAEIVDAFLVQIKAEESDHIKSVWQKKFGRPAEDALEQMKQQRFLQNRGFSHDAIRQLFITLGEGEDLNFPVVDEMG
ncbi:MAG TPA: recombination regulator RecX [Burkholderiales bacterium]|nr:recombination regulator RecX [Burkholderiales bacterium]